MNQQDLDNLTIIHYPDPRLKKRAIEIDRFDDDLAALAGRMLELMKDARGVGLAAPQVGLPLRLFVMNATGRADDDLVFVNPRLSAQQGNADDEEGCLSIPDVRVQVRRAVRCRIDAQDVRGEPIAFEGEDLVSRVWQHETDHLNGVLIIDRMSASDRIATRRTLRELEAKWQNGRG